MVQVFSVEPTMSTAGLVGQAMAQGLAKRAGIAEAEQAFQDAQGDPLKLATAFARLTSVSPELARGAGPMYEAMLRNMQGQAIRRGAGGAGGTPEQMQQEPLTRNQQVTAQPEQFIPQMGQMPQQPTEPVPVSEETPGIQTMSPVGQEQMEKPYWSPQQRMQQQAYYMDLGFLPEQAIQQAQLDEERYMANPAQYRKNYDLLEERKAKARAELMRQLELKTQKKFDATEPEKNIFKDIPGEYIIGLEKGMERDLLTKGEPESVVADRWTTRALNTIKAKDDFEKFAATEGIENLLKGRQGLDSLEQFSDIFAESGHSEQYFNLLKDKTKFSPQAAASIAFRNRPEIKNQIDKNVQKYTPSRFGVDQGPQARRLANQVAENLNPNDSFLSVAWEARRKNPLFDERKFFSHLKNIQGEYNFSPRQKREIAQGASGFIPYWADILFFPWMGE